jgi:hemerythrin-like domain-containing protein
MEAARFEALRREHRQILRAVSRLEADLRRAAHTDSDEPALLAPLGEFLELCDEALEPHMKYEEEQVYPELDRYLPPEVGSGLAMLREHETMRGLIAILRRGRTRLQVGVDEAGADLASAVRDLALLLRDHIRKEDHVINPLLQRLLKERRGA